MNTSGIWLHLVTPGISVFARVALVASRLWRHGGEMVVGDVVSLRDLFLVIGGVWT